MDLRLRSAPSLSNFNSTPSPLSVTWAVLSGLKPVAICAFAFKEKVPAKQQQTAINFRMFMTGIYTFEDMDVIMSADYRSNGSLTILGSCEGEVARTEVEAFGTDASIGFLKTISAEMVTGKVPLMTFA